MKVAPASRESVESFANKDIKHLAYTSFSKQQWQGSVRAAHSGSVRERPGSDPGTPFLLHPGHPFGDGFWNPDLAKKHEKERFLSAPVFRVSVTAY